MRLAGYVFGCAVALAIAMPAFAESLEVKKMHAQQEADLATAVALTNSKCGGNLATKIDWTTFDEARP